MLRIICCFVLQSQSLSGKVQGLSFFLIGSNSDVASLLAIYQPHQSRTYSIIPSDTVLTLKNFIYLFSDFHLEKKKKAQNEGLTNGLESQ